MTAPLRTLAELVSTASSCGESSQLEDRRGGSGGVRVYAFGFRVRDL